MHIQLAKINCKQGRCCCFKRLENQILLGSGARNFSCYESYKRNRMKKRANYACAGISETNENLMVFEDDFGTVLDASND